MGDRGRVLGNDSTILVTANQPSGDKYVIFIGYKKFSGDGDQGPVSDVYVQMPS